ncbi:MAG: DNA polymerase III subunit gamma/tau [Sulfurospirillaceae bacterium]|nr:DNA polymerase III subunit gamma/tau [Sulfurospirillaceae bacterium]MDD3462249.1 DNA polymerase III subunit gamma/tau [Sulfurospirillaceae bacterium]
MSKVLALKYRPTTFDKLIGQESVIQTLTLALDKDRLSHAYLFSGLRGSGKTSTARIFAKALVCDKGPSSTPCEVCENCLMARENRHIDIIEMDAASSRKIDDIRDLIENTKYKPSTARFKIFIIDEVHMLTKEAFNALLKTLEEPPSYVKFILATTDPLKLPATILSRTQHFRFKQINQKDIVHHLSYILDLENINYTIEALEMLSRSGNGSLRDTLTLLDQAIIFSKGYVKPENIASMLGLLDPTQLEEIFDVILSGDKQRLIKIIKELENYECEIIIDELIAYLKNAFLNQDTRFSILLCERFFRILSESKTLLHINANNGFVLSLLFFKMIEATNIKSVEEMIKTLESEKFRIQDDKKNALLDIIKEKKAQKPTSKEDDETQNIQPANNASEDFKKLIAKLYDRNHELGECFEKNIAFVGYENETLTLESHAQEECRKTLRNASAIIKHFVQDLFGLQTTIQMSHSEKKEDEQQKAMLEAEQHANENSSSMIENEEFSPDEEFTQGCVSRFDPREKKELDATEILNDPFVKKATELFEPTKIKIHQKV